ncbi:class I SAM-dependent methyltransferase [Streptomyces sp. NPDC054975]
MNTLRRQRSAALWDDLYAAPDVNFASIPRTEVGQFQDRVAAGAGQVVIDVGTGLGEWACRVSRLGLTVTGYDYSPVAIESARRLQHNHGPLSFEIHDFDAGAIPRRLQRDSVEIVSCRHVLHFLEMPRFIADARRWLRKDGVLHVTTAVTEKMRDGRHVGLREEEVRELARGWRESTGTTLTRTARSPPWFSAAPTPDPSASRPQPRHFSLSHTDPTARGQGGVGALTEEEEHVHP